MIHQNASKLLIIVLFSGWTFRLIGADFFVDPIAGDMSNDGSFEAPWRTLQEVFEQNKIESLELQDHPYVPGIPLVVKNPGAPVKAGDTIYLRSGYHGEVHAVEYFNSDFITITNQAGHHPTMGRVEFRSGSRWMLEGVTISPELAPTYQPDTLIRFDSHGYTGPISHCVLHDCVAYSVWDASTWTLTDWNELACNGISVTGENIVVSGSSLKNVNFGISVTEAYCTIEDNVIENFSGDALRGLGDYCTFEHNTVMNCFDVNGNHDDGFQSWSVGPGGVGTGTVYGVVLRGNTIINTMDENQPFRGTLQGIGCFDGFFEDWIVENNVVIVDHWHGITLLGAINCRIVNNTVIDGNPDETPGPPWIRIGDHKDGTPSQNCLERNNLSTSFNNDDGVDLDHNLTLAGHEYDVYFLDAARHDLHLKSGCPAVDSGVGTGAPTQDRDGNPRPIGSDWDIGAYEYYPCQNLLRSLAFWPMDVDVLDLIGLLDCD